MSTEKRMVEEFTVPCGHKFRDLYQENERIRCHGCDAAGREQPAQTEPTKRSNVICPDCGAAADTEELLGHAPDCGATDLRRSGDYHEKGCKLDDSHAGKCITPQTEPHISTYNAAGVFGTVGVAQSEAGEKPRVKERKA